mgnify:CR=1 FL=1
MIERSGSESAIFDEDSPTGPPIGVELYAVTRGVGHLAITNRDIAPSSGDAVSILVVLVGAGEEVVNSAILNEDTSSEHTNSVTAAVTDFAISQDDIVGGNLDEITGIPLSIDDEVLVETGFRDFESINNLCPSSRTDRSGDPNKSGEKKGGGQEKEDDVFHCHVRVNR